MNKLLSFLLLLFSWHSYTQIKGKVSDINGQELPFVNIYLANTTQGTTSNENGFYELNVYQKGEQTIIFQYLGFKTLKKNITIDSFPFELDITLKEENVSLEEVNIVAKENPANRIIRNTIAKRKIHLNKINEYTSDFYSRSLYKIKNAPDKILGQDVGDLGGGLDSTRSGIVYLSETMSKITIKRPNQFKENILASKVSGDDSGFSFNTASSVNFSFYENTIPIIEKVVSPLAEFAFDYYRYKLEGILYQDDITINKIKVIAKRPNDRSFEGYIYIVDDVWELYGIDLNITGEDIFFPALDTLNLKQSFKYNESQKCWIIISQVFDFKYKFFGIKGNGKFTAVYSNYNFNPAFNNDTFTNEVLLFNKEANDKEQQYWDEERPIKLTTEEVDDYLLKDSLQVIRKSKPYLDSIDLIKNKPKLTNLLYGYTFNNSYKKRSYSISSPLLAFQYNTVQGWHSNMNFSFVQRNKAKNTWIKSNVLVDYGLSDKKARILGSLGVKFNNFSKPILTFSGGKQLSQFNDKPPITPLVNTISTLFFEDNYAKFYDKTFAELRFSNEFWNGIVIRSSLSYENRKPVFNTSSYVTINEDDDFYTANNPVDENGFTTSAITDHNIFKVKVNARIRFNQKYYTYPDGKFNEYSRKTPNVYLGFESGFASNEKKNNYSHLNTRVYQNVNLNNKGRFVYNIKAGTFIDGDDISFVDYKHFNGNQTHISSEDMYVTNYNLMPYYTFSTNTSYLEAHLEHNFQGYILNRLPILKKLNYFLVLGGHLASIDGNKPYTEYSIGLENLGWGKFRFLRFDYVRSNCNGVQKDGVVFGLKFLNLINQ